MKKQFGAIACLLMTAALLFCSACGSSKGTVVYEEYVDPGPTPVWDEPAQYEYGKVLVANEGLGIVFEGVQIVGDRGDVTAQEQAAPAMKGVKATFEQGESVKIKVVPAELAEGDLEIFCIPHRSKRACQAESFMVLSEDAYHNGFVASVTREEDHTFTGSGTFKADYPAGEYDLLFYYEYSLCYYMTVKVTEPGEARAEATDAPTDAPAEDAN